MDFLSRAVQLEFQVIHEAKDQAATLRMQIVALLSRDPRARLIGEDALEPGDGGVGVAGESKRLDVASWEELMVGS